MAGKMNDRSNITVHAQDPRGRNLLLRLFTYSERARQTPIENFCTEALAWCLANAPAFRKRFLSLTGIGIVSRTQENLDVSTQQGSRSSLGHEPEVPRGIFDILIHPIPSCQWVLVIEAKIGGTFQKDQLLKYRSCFQSSRRFGGAAVYIVTLTTSTLKPVGADAHIRWSDVQLALMDVECGAAGSRQVDENSGPGTFLCGQFAQFLKEKGLAPMTIKGNPEQVASYRDGLKLHENVRRLLERLRERPGLRAYLNYKRGPRPVVYEDSTGVWIGMHTAQAVPENLGIWLKNLNGAPRMLAVAEGYLAGKQEAHVRRRFSKRRRGWKPWVDYNKDLDQTWFGLEHLIDSSSEDQSERIESVMAEMVFELRRLGAVAG